MSNIGKHYVRSKPPKSITRRPAKSIIPPDIVDGGPPDRPAIVRQTKLRYASTWHKHKQTAASASWIKKPHVWRTVEIVVPREIVEVAGWTEGMTLCMEGYVDGRVRVFPAGDILNREEEMV
jgi:hypothetical protein